MFDVSCIYDPIRNRYKGVYPAHKRPGSWEVLVTTSTGKLRYLATFSSQEEGAQKVAAYYEEQYGSEWPQILEDRKRRLWRIKKIQRSSSTVVYIAQVRGLGSRDWKTIIGQDVDSTYNWSEMGDGWLSSAAALVAIRIYRFTHSVKPSVLLPPGQHQSSSVVPTAQRSNR